MKRWLWSPLAVLVPLLAASSDYLSAKRKFDLIESEKLRPGSRVNLSSRELNAYVANEIVEASLQGVREPKLELGDGLASGTALIDFLKLRQSSGKSSGWMMSKLLAGERPVRVTAHIKSGSGRAEVDVDRVGARCAVRLPDGRERAGVEDLPVRAGVGVAVGVAEPGRLHVHVGWMNELPVGARLGDHGGGRRGSARNGWGQQNDERDGQRRNGSPDQTCIPKITGARGLAPLSPSDTIRATVWVEVDE